MYWLIAWVNPGRIESAKEKAFLNDRFKRLEEELKHEQEEDMFKNQVSSEFTPGGDETNFGEPKNKRIPVFQDALDNLLYHNSFEPSEVINYKMKDNRHFRFCQEC